MKFRLLAASAIFCLPSAALGMTFSVPLEALVGPIDFPASSGGRTAHFDFGQQFSEIESVSIELEARVRAQEYDVCASPFDPQSCVHEIHLLGFWAIMDDQENEVPGTIFTHPGLSFPVVGIDGREAYGTDIRRFSNPLVGWDFLLDGESNLTLYWNRELGDPDRFIRNVVEPTGEILSARLVINGAAIPEPSTACLVALGLLVLSRPRIGADRIRH